MASTLGYRQLESLWVSAGGSRVAAAVAAAIALAESGGRTGVTSSNPDGGMNVGPWQIDTRGVGSGYSVSQLQDPRTNARLAVHGSGDGSNWSPWATWASGAYRHYLKGGQPPQSTYRNPLRGVSGLRAERVDMGVDYAGSGPVYALGPGVIKETTNAGWPGGGMIVEELSQGPLRGRDVYVAENIHPRVRIGQRVTDKTVIGDMTGGIETGFAAPPPNLGTTLAAVSGQISPGDPGAHPTAYGQAYSQILGNLGAPSGIQTASATGHNPGWLQRALHDITSIPGDIGGAIGNATGLGQVAHSIGRIGDFLGTLSTAIDWLLNPANWVRIFAGVGGGTLVLVGAVRLSHVGGENGSPAALPIGVVMVGLGSVGLFVAFHNLSSPDFPSLLGDINQGLHGGKVQGPGVDKSPAVTIA